MDISFEVKNLSPFRDNFGVPRVKGTPSYITFSGSGVGQAGIPTRRSLIVCTLFIIDLVWCRVF